LIFQKTSLAGLYLIRVEKNIDNRGYFARSYCKNEFAAAGIEFEPVQCNISFNEKRGTLRGMHYQQAPYGESKIVSCASGSIFDAVVDLRPDSPTRYAWQSFIIDSSENDMLFIPEGFAHGFQTLEDRVTVYYQMGNFYRSDSARGIRWDDGAFGIEWPVCGERIISARDKSYGDFIK